MKSLGIAKLSDTSYITANTLQHNKEDFNGVHNIDLKIAHTQYPSISNAMIPKGHIGMNTFVRNHLNVGFYDSINITLIDQKKDNRLREINIRIAHASKRVLTNLHEDQIKEAFIQNFKNYYLYTSQCLYQEIQQTKLILYITNYVEGYVDSNTTINITSDDSLLNIIGSAVLKRDLFRDDYNFEAIGVGGLDKELVNILRRCLSTRAYKPEVIEKLGIKHVKGMLLYGPPGTGKTLIARRIGSMISSKEPKIVNGPEIKNKYIGESEKNIRELFSEAIADTDTNVLHVIIFDEIDAICKTRGRNSGSSDVGDSIVNQLLTMIDGYKQLNNIFIIAMTNRKDLLDSALLRAGRLEVHVEIGLPDQEGREQIFRIHTNNMKVNNMINSNVNINELAMLTENYSGAEIEAVVRNAGTRSLHENLMVSEKEMDVILTRNHFIGAIDEVIPSFGNITKQALLLLPKNYQHKSEKHAFCYDESCNFIKQNKRLKTILINGDSDCGKTILAIKIAIDSNITNVKIIRPIDLVAFDEIGKAQYITDIVTSSYVSTNSLIVIDDIEIAINYAMMGNNITFSNRLYQVLVTLLKTEPSTPDHQITFICTSTDNQFEDTIKHLFDITHSLI